MVGVLILTHGPMAAELLAAAKKIAGELEHFEALTLDWAEGVDPARHKVGAAIDRLDLGEGVLVLTDIFGGTPSNIAMSLAEPGRVEVISGVNLPMVVRLGCLHTASMPISELTTWIQGKARASICTSQTLPRPGKRLDPREPSPCEPSPCEPSPCNERAAGSASASPGPDPCSDPGPAARPESP